MRSIYSSLFAFTVFSTFSQGWTWIKGDSVTNQNGIFGSLGVSSPSNQPGSRYSGASWKDANGKFWMFGGYGKAAACTGFLNDLWKYDPAINEWVWMKGDNLCDQNGNYGTVQVAAASNKPGCRSTAAYCTDASGNLWLFGGFGLSAVGGPGYLNDLWKYDVSSDQWIWMKGDNSGNQMGVYGTQGTPAPTNKPGAREYASCWADNSGNIWLFGGFGYDGSGGINLLNDLWKYNILSGQWAWMKGSNTVNQVSTFGTMGTAAPGNKPGARQSQASWTDASGNLWLFGGGGYANPANGQLNDLWKFNPANNQWTFMKGDSLINKNGVYGNLGSADPNNKPGARTSVCTWTDPAGALWMFAGTGHAFSGSAGDLNDLWKYDIANNQWAWMSGDSIKNQNGNYGVMGTQNPANKPGSRNGSVAWIDANNDLWFFGGSGLPATGPAANLSDLWQFSLSAPTKIKKTVTDPIEITLFPNPSNSILKIKNASDGEIKISNQAGEIVFKKNLKSEEELNLENLPAGIYIVTVQAGERRKNFKLVKN